MGIIKFDIHTVEEFIDTLFAGYPIIYSVKKDSCVVPDIIGYFKTMVNDKEEEMCALVLLADQKQGIYLNREVFNRLAIDGTVYGDMMIRIFSKDTIADVFNSIRSDAQLFAPLCISSDSLY